MESCSLAKKLNEHDNELYYLIGLSFNYKKLDNLTWIRASDEIMREKFGYAIKSFEENDFGHFNTDEYQHYEQIQVEEPDYD